MSWKSAWVLYSMLLQKLQSCSHYASANSKSWITILSLTKNSASITNYTLYLKSVFSAKVHQTHVVHLIIFNVGQGWCWKHRLVVNTLQRIHKLKVCLEKTGHWNLCGICWRCCIWEIIWQRTWAKWTVTVNANLWRLHHCITNHNHTYFLKPRICRPFQNFLHILLWRWRECNELNDGVCCSPVWPNVRRYCIIHSFFQYRLKMVDKIQCVFARVFWHILRQNELLIHW